MSPRPVYPSSGLLGLAALLVVCVPAAAWQNMPQQMSAALATMAEMPDGEYREAMEAAELRGGACPARQTGNHSLGTTDTCSGMDHALYMSHYSMCKCKPRETIVSLLNVDTPNMLIPSMVSVNRCSGWCSTMGHSCLATRTAPKSVTLLHIHPSNRGIECGPLVVEEDTACRCGCPLTAADCNDRQEFVADQCRCRCKKTPEYRRGCGVGRRWDHRRCRCVCEREQECSTGLGWSNEYCRCLRMMMPTNEDFPPAYDNSVRY